MALSKLRSESIDLTDDFAFTGTVTGAGSEGLIHLETQNTTTAVADMSFGNDVFNTTYDRYYIVCRMTVATSGASVYFRFLDSTETEISGVTNYRYTINNGSGSNNTFGILCQGVGSNQDTESGAMIFANVWLPHVANQDYESHVFSESHRINDSQVGRSDHIHNQLRADVITTQPEGMKIYPSTGNFAKAMISVFAVSEG